MSLNTQRVSGFIKIKRMQAVPILKRSFLKRVLQVRHFNLNKKRTFHICPRCSLYTYNGLKYKLYYSLMHYILDLPQIGTNLTSKVGIKNHPAPTHLRLQDLKLNAKFVKKN